MKVRLGDYIKEYSEKNKADEKIPVYSVTNTQGFCQDYFGKEVASKDKTTYKIVPRGCFAYNPSRINVGSVDWQRNEERVIVSPLYNVFSVSKELDQEYLYYYLKSDFALQRIRVVATGSVRDNLKLEMLKEFPILLPPKDIQKAIANNLDRVKRIIALRKIEIEKLDELIKARFVEFFVGKKYEIVKAGSIIKEMRNGVSPSTSGGHFEKVLTLSAITQGKFDDKAWKEGFFTDCPSAEKRITEDDFYICRGNGNKSLVGMGVYALENRADLVFPDTVIAVHIDTERMVLPYLWIMWQQPEVRKQLESGARTTNGTYKINQKVISEIKIICPPINEQEVFADFIKQVNKSKVAVQKALDETKLLFDSLMQQYFG